MQRCLRIAAAIVALGVFAACTHAVHGTQSDAGTTLTVAIQKEPIALDPLVLEGLSAYTFSELLYSYLTNYDSNGRTVPDLARDVPTPENGGVSPDGKRLTFHLRHGVHWQDGAPVTSQDVVFTYHAVMNPANNVPERIGYDEIASIAAPDPYTVVITLKRPYSPIVALFFGGDSNYPILPAHLLAAKANVNNDAFNSAPVGSGPYRLDRWERGDRLTFAANATYFAGKPKINRLVLPVIANDSTTIDELQSGEIDAAFMMDASRIDQLRAIPRHRVVVTPVPYFYALGFNLTDPILRDLNVRRAFAMGIDRRSLTEKITHGVYDPDAAMRGLFTWAYDPTVTLPPYDPAQSAALLTQDGWIPGPNGIRVKQGRPLHLEISFAIGEGITTRFATAVAAEERAIGIDVSLHQYDRTQFLSIQGPMMQGRYQITLYDYQATYDPDVSWLLACDQRGPHGFNDTRFCDSQVDALLARGASSYDRSTRASAYRQIQRRLADELPYAFLCQISEVDVIPENLRGFAPPLLSPFNSIAGWHYGTSLSMTTSVNASVPSGGVPSASSAVRAPVAYASSTARSMRAALRSSSKL